MADNAVAKSASTLFPQLFSVYTSHSLPAHLDLRPLLPPLPVYQLPQPPVFDAYKFYEPDGPPEEFAGNDSGSDSEPEVGKPTATPPTPLTLFRAAPPKPRAPLQDAWDTWFPECSFTGEAIASNPWLKSYSARPRSIALVALPLPPALKSSEERSVSEKRKPRIRLAIGSDDGGIRFFRGVDDQELAALERGAVWPARGEDRPEPWDDDDGQSDSGRLSPNAGTPRSSMSPDRDHSRSYVHTRPTSPASPTAALMRLGFYGSSRTRSVSQASTATFRSSNINAMNARLTSQLQIRPQQLHRTPSSNSFNASSDDPSPPAHRPRKASATVMIQDLDAEALIRRPSAPPTSSSSSASGGGRSKSKVTIKRHRKATPSISITALEAVTSSRSQGRPGASPSPAPSECLDSTITDDTKWVSSAMNANSADSRASTSSLADSSRESVSELWEGAQARSQPVRLTLPPLDSISGKDSVPPNSSFAALVDGPASMSPWDDIKLAHFFDVFPLASNPASCSGAIIWMAAVDGVVHACEDDFYFDQPQPSEEGEGDMSGDLANSRGVGNGTALVCLSEPGRLRKLSLLDGRSLAEVDLIKRDGPTATFSGAARWTSSSRGEMLLCFVPSAGLVVPVQLTDLVVDAPLAVSTPTPYLSVITPQESHNRPYLLAHSATGAAMAYALAEEAGNLQLGPPETVYSPSPDAGLDFLCGVSTYGDKSLAWTPYVCRVFGVKVGQASAWVALRCSWSSPRGQPIRSAELVGDDVVVVRFNERLRLFRLILKPLAPGLQDVESSQANGERGEPAAGSGKKDAGPRDLLFQDAGYVVLADDDEVERFEALPSNQSTLLVSLLRKGCRSLQLVTLNDLGDRLYGSGAGSGKKAVEVALVPAFEPPPLASAPKQQAHGEDDDGTELVDTIAVCVTMALRLEGDCVVGDSSGSVHLLRPNDSGAWKLAATSSERLNGAVTCLTSTAGKLLAGTATGELAVLDTATLSVGSVTSTGACPIQNMVPLPALEGCKVSGGFIAISATGAITCCALHEQTEVERRSDAEEDEEPNVWQLSTVSAPLRALWHKASSLLALYSDGAACRWDLENLQQEGDMEKMHCDAALQLIGGSVEWSCLLDVLAPVGGVDSPAVSAPTMNRTLIPICLRRLSSVAGQAGSDDARSLDTARKLLSQASTWGIDPALDDCVRVNLDAPPPLCASAFLVPAGPGSDLFVALPCEEPIDPWTFSPTYTAQRLLMVTVLLHVFLNDPTHERHASEATLAYTLLHNRIGPSFQPPDFALFVKYWLDSTVEVKEAARLLFGASAAALSDAAVLKLSARYRSALPCQLKRSAEAEGVPIGEAESQRSAEAMLLVGLLAADRYKALSSSVLRDLSVSVFDVLRQPPSLYAQVVAVEICAKAFSILQHYVDAMDLVRMLFGLVTGRDPATPQDLRAMARHAALTVASVNTPLFMTTLSYDIVSAQEASHRIATMKLVAFMVRKKPLILHTSLPRLAEAIVKSLDPTQKALRTATQNAATVILHSLVQTYPSISFHGASQRLAVGTPEGAVIVYDVRTATRVFVLEGHRHAVTAVSFSPDGRRLVSVSLDDGKTEVWKVGGTGGVLGYLPRQAAGGVAGLLAGNGASGGGSVGPTPYKTFPFNVGEEGNMSIAATLEWVVFEWLAERRCKLRIRESSLIFAV